MFFERDSIVSDIQRLVIRWQFCVAAFCCHRLISGRRISGLGTQRTASSSKLNIKHKYVMQHHDVTSTFIKPCVLLRGPFVKCHLQGRKTGSGVESPGKESHRGRDYSSLG